LPDIQRHKINKNISVKSYKTADKNNKRKLKNISSSIENKHFRNDPRQEIGHSFVSFNANNSSKNKQQMPM